MAKKALKKRWVKIVASKAFNNAELGETYVTNPKDTIGRRLTVSLSALGIDTRQNINVQFEITQVMGDRLVASITGYKIMPSSVKRMVRRMRDKLVDSFIVITKDGVKVRVKPILVTRFQTTSSVKTEMRGRVRNKIAIIFEKSTYEAVMKDVISHRVQKSLFDGLKKLFPLSVCELRWVVKLEEGESLEEEVVEVTEETKTPPVKEPKTETPAQETKPVEAPAEPKAATEA